MPAENRVVGEAGGVEASLNLLAGSSLLWVGRIRRGRANSVACGASGRDGVAGMENRDCAVE